MIKTTRILISSVCLFFALPVFSQDSVLYQWQVTSKKLGEKKYEIIFRTSGAKGWQLYAPDQVFDDFKTTEIIFPDSSIHQLGNFSASGDTKIIHSTIFQRDVKVYEGNTEWGAIIELDSIVPGQLQGVLHYSYGRNDEFYPSTIFRFNIPLEGGVASSTRIKINTIDIKHPVSNCGDDDTAGKSLFGIFILGLAGGLIALLTPCVFPLIPLTVSFFTKKQGQNKKKGVANAALYGFFIFLIYVLLSVPFHILNATPEVLNNISTNIWVNLFFFVVFLVFAISFFGYFEITLPGGIANSVNSKSGIGSWGGIFFMAFTLAIVSFSCTGPILGSLLVGAISDHGGPMQLTFGMGGFGLGLALPFAVFAVFPGWLQSLPKSGGWLNSVKVVLGFLELAMAVKFFSNADLVKQWGFLKRETFMSIWIVIGIGIILYLLGKIRFPHDSPVKKFSKSRIAFLIVFIVGTLYLLPGVTNTKWANLRLISGFPPPLCYSVYENPVNCKKGFEPLKDYELALQRARKENKPILIDFTGWACVNCRRMEEKVWTDPDVDSLMRNKFVVVSLYVDERRKLPVQQQLLYKTKTGDEKSIITVGDKWSTFQFENFDAVSQPQYAIISTDEKALTKTKGYTPKASEFAGWLECGLEAFRK
jgi:thiol:disulfide interchange protein